MFSYIRMIFNGYCPKCRKAKLFKYKLSYFSKRNLEMVESCPKCGQLSAPGVGFYYGTGYVSYALTVTISVFTFIAYWLLAELPFYQTSSLIIWLVINLVILLVTQPFLMRISRIIWLSFFV